MANDKSISRINMEHDIAKNRALRAERRGTRKYRNMEKAEAEAFIAEAKGQATLREDGEVELKAETPPKAPRSTRKPREYNFTAEALIAARSEGKGRSWAELAKMFDLGNPGAARKAWAELTGTPHTEAPELSGRARKGSSASRTVAAPEWNDDTDRQEIVDRLVGSTITIRRTLYGKTQEEVLDVAKVFKYDDTNPERPAVDFLEGRYQTDSKTGVRTVVGTGARRTVFIDQIVEVR
jgi:hypothetical protein